MHDALLLAADCLLIDLVVVVRNHPASSVHHLPANHHHQHPHNS
jgi:hypothetical protein